MNEGAHGGRQTRKIVRRILRSACGRESFGGKAFVGSHHIIRHTIMSPPNNG